MRLWVLSQLVDSPGTATVLGATARAGHAAELVHPAKLWLAAGVDGPGDTLRFEAAGLADPRLPQVVFTRMGAASSADYLDVLVALEARGLPVINSAAALWSSRDKLRAGMILARAGVPLPATLGLGLGAPEPTIAAVRAALGSPPWVLKAAVGAKGESVHLAHDDAELLQLTRALQEVGGRPIAQEFIAESAGTDTRLLVIDGRVRGAMVRRGRPGDFRSNLHQGGSAAAVQASAEQIAVALKASAALELDVAGVDLVSSDRGPLVLEVNGSPGFAGIEQATGADLAGELIEFLETRALD